MCVDNPSDSITMITYFGNITHLFLLHQLFCRGPDNITFIHFLKNFLFSSWSFLQRNNIATISDETFCKTNDTHYIRANMEEVRLDGNPLLLAKHPKSFLCLRALPIGNYHWHDHIGETCSKLRFQKRCTVEEGHDSFEWLYNLLLLSILQKTPCSFMSAGWSVE